MVKRYSQSLSLRRHVFPRLISKTFLPKPLPSNPQKCLRYLFPQHPAQYQAYPRNVIDRQEMSPKQLGQQLCVTSNLKSWSIPLLNRQEWSEVEKQRRAEAKQRVPRPSPLPADRFFPCYSRTISYKALPWDDRDALTAVLDQRVLFP